MRECRKCKNAIPNNIVIDGVTKNLRNRKFCLTCSPWGLNNRQPNEPTKLPTTHKRKYDSKRKEIIILSLYKRAIKRKSDLVSLKGGKCQSCGYSKSLRCLSFHHRDREEKLFGFSVSILWSKPWDLIVKEVEKCDLLCLNCHMELEEKLSSENGGTIVDRVNAKYGTNF